MGAHVPFPKKPAAAQALSSWMTDRKKARQKDEVHGYIESYLTAKGVPRPEKVHEDDGWHFLILGSARGPVGFVEDGGDLYLHIDALLMDKLPSDQDLMLPLMRELLELNASLPDPIRLVIANEMVFVMASRRLTDLSKSEVQTSIETVMAIADGLDDKFMAKYSGTSRRREG